MILWAIFVNSRYNKNYLSIVTKHYISVDLNKKSHDNILFSPLQNKWCLKSNQVFWKIFYANKKEYSNSKEYLLLLFEFISNQLTQFYMISFWIKKKKIDMNIFVHKKMSKFTFYWSKKIKITPHYNFRSLIFLLLAYQLILKMQITKNMNTQGRSK